MSESSQAWDMKNPDPSPALSVVLPTSRGLSNVVRTLRALRAQTVRHRLSRGGNRRLNRAIASSS